MGNTRIGRVSLSNTTGKFMTIFFRRGGKTNAHGVKRRCGDANYSIGLVTQDLSFLYVGSLAPRRVV